MGITDIESCLVLAGGESDEREVSIQSGKAVYEALLTTQLNTELLILEKDEVDISFLNDYDVIFIAMHGQYGEDGGLQKYLYDNDIPFTGSLEKCCRDSFDKHVSKNIFNKSKISTPRWIISSSLNELSEKLSEFSFPAVIKPVRGGSSQGVLIVNSHAEAKEAVFNAFNYCREVMVEEFIAGRELTVGILDNESLPVIELRTSREFYDYKAKYEDDDTEYICPAELDEDVENGVRQLALKTFDALGAKDFGRVDIMLDNSNNPYVLELNVIPGFTSHSLLPKAAAVDGLSFPDLCLKIIELALIG
ncbi:MAG: D-alanine--D-alanine ligase family protein [Planctomycetota bacterium]|jgi:D-alanine-D-alanine ligase